MHGKDQHGLKRLEPIGPIFTSFSVMPAKVAKTISRLVLNLFDMFFIHVELQLYRDIMRISNDFSTELT